MPFLRHLFLFALLPLQVERLHHPNSYHLINTWFRHMCFCYQNIYCPVLLGPSALGPTGGSFPGGKARPGRDADRSPPSSAEVKKE
jgi:hypothetical protein